MAMTFRQTYGFVDRRLRELLASPTDGPMKAALAELRRGVGRIPGDQPELWGILFRELPEDALSRDGTPTAAEWAIYASLTLFALHQQSRDIHSEPMTRQGQSLGRAVRRLVPAGDSDAQERVLRRFNAMATSGDMAELTYHLRGIVQLLRGAGIPLDYPALAYDLHRYQTPGLAPEVRLSWGQDFYRIWEEDNKEKDGKDEQND